MKMYLQKAKSSTLYQTKGYESTLIDKVSENFIDWRLRKAGGVLRLCPAWLQKVFKMIHILLESFQKFGNVIPVGDSMMAGQ